MTQFKVLTYLLTYLSTPWSRYLLEKLTASQLVKKLPAFYGTRRFTTVFTSARHLSLSRASSIQSISPYPTSWRSMLILSSHLRLGLPSGLFPSGYHTKTLYTRYMPRPYRISSGLNKPSACTHYNVSSRALRYVYEHLLCSELLG